MLYSPFGKNIIFLKANTCSKNSAGFILITNLFFFIDNLVRNISIIFNMLIHHFLIIFKFSAALLSIVLFASSLNVTSLPYSQAILFLPFSDTLVSLFDHVPSLLFSYIFPFALFFSFLPHHLKINLLLHIIPFDYLLRLIHTLPFFFV